jgi:hypothetical protein
MNLPMRCFGGLMSLLKNGDNGMQTSEDVPYRISAESVARQKISLRAYVNQASLWIKMFKNFCNFPKCWCKFVSNLTISMEGYVGYVTNCIYDHTVNHVSFCMNTAKNRNFPTTFGTSYIMVQFQNRKEPG